MVVTVVVAFGVAAQKIELRKVRNKSYVCSALAYRPGRKAWFAANGHSPLLLS